MDVILIFVKVGCSNAHDGCHSSVDSIQTSNMHWCQDLSILVGFHSYIVSYIVMDGLDVMVKTE